MMPTFTSTLVALGLSVAGQPLSAEDVPRETAAAPGDEVVAGLEGPAADEALSYVIVRQAVPSFLETVATDANRRFVIDPNVRGVLSNSTYEGDVETILDAVATDGEIEWFDFGDTIYVSPRGSSTTRLTRLGDVSYDDALAILGQTGLIFDRFPLQRAAGGASIAVTGPPRYLALVEGVLESMPTAAPPDVVGPMPRPTEPYIVVRRALDVTHEPIRRGGGVRAGDT